MKTEDLIVYIVGVAICYAYIKLMYGRIVIDKDTGRDKMLTTFAEVLISMLSFAGLCLMVLALFSRRVGGSKYHYDT